MHAAAATSPYRRLAPLALVFHGVEHIDSIGLINLGNESATFVFPIERSTSSSGPGGNVCGHETRCSICRLLHEDVLRDVLSGESGRDQRARIHGVCRRAASSRRRSCSSSLGSASKWSSSGLGALFKKAATSVGMLKSSVAFASERWSGTQPRGPRRIWPGSSRKSLVKTVQSARSRSPRRYLQKLKLRVRRDGERRKRAARAPSQKKGSACSALGQFAPTCKPYGHCSAWNSTVRSGLSFVRLAAAATKQSPLNFSATGIVCSPSKSQRQRPRTTRDELLHEACRVAGDAHTIHVHDAISDAHTRRTGDHDMYFKPGGRPAGYANPARMCEDQTIVLKDDVKLCFAPGRRGDAASRAFRCRREAMLARGKSAGFSHGVEGVRKKRAERRLHGQAETGAR